jgi:hypothetical protein
MQHHREQNQLKQNKDDYEAQLIGTTISIYLSIYLSMWSLTIPILIKFISIYFY